ncbi:MAG: hypothetical protein AB1486_31310 [Planctomycetota bacterium]
MRRCVLLLVPALVALGFFAPFLGPSRAFLAVHTDYWDGWRQAAPPGAAERAGDQANLVMTDTLLMFHPEVCLTVEELRRGALPTWNPFALGGLPHIATGIPSAFYPFGLIALLIAPPHSYAVAALLQALVAGLLMMAFLRHSGLRVPSCLLGSVLFVLSGWMTTHMLYYQISGSAVWLPLMLLAADWIHAGRWRRGVAGLAVATGASCLAGFPQVTLMSLLVAGAWALCRAFSRPSASRGGPPLLPAVRLLAAGLGVGLGVLLGAVQLLPTCALTFSPYTNRPLPDPSELQELGLEPEALATALCPDAFGHPQWEKHLQASTLKRSLFAAAHLSERSNYEETQLYLGLVPLLLVPFAAGSRPRRLSILGVALVLIGLALALGTPFLRLVAALPGMSVGDPKRFLYLVTFGLILLAAVGLERLLERAPRRAMLTLAVTVGLVALAGLGAAFRLTRVDPAAFRDTMARAVAEGPLGRAFALTPEQVAGGLPAADFEANRSLLRENLLRLSIGLAVSMLAVMSFLGRRAHLSAALVIALAAADLTAVGRETGLPDPLRFLGRGFNRPVSTEGFYRVTRLTEFLTRELAGEPWRLCRYGTEGSYPRRPADLLYPSKTLQPLHIEDAQGYVALYLRRYQLFQEALEPSPSRGGPARTGTTHVACLSRPESLDSRALDLLGVRYLLTREPLSHPDFALVAQDGPFRVYENTRVLPRAFVAPEARLMASLDEVLQGVRDRTIEPERVVLLDPEADEKPCAPLSTYPAGASRVRWLGRSTRHIDLDVESSGGWLVVTDNYFPGWVARVDGEEQPIYPAFGAFRAIEVPAGQHRVTMRHAAPAEHAGLWSSAAGVIVLLLLPLVRRGRRV